ncbi:YcaO-like family protein (plasmid) [Ensifer adhaerens]|uniref:YcaO-like family protein n=1 Tax=Ensifer adhaerens TaxID=106592 RepID=UPI0023A94733|nr:YcaO-like family protein [Ensifer adhaerens]WDZ81386.1 YcaO-like family protein [Ensifer adhaerens]
MLSYSDRACSPEETLRRIEPLLPTFGVSRLARLTRLDKIGIPVWSAISPNARSIVINQGKGITDNDAKVSAAMEAIERAVACAPAVPARMATRRTLCESGDQALTLPGLAAAGKPDLGDDETISWLRGFNLTDGTITWAPLHATTLDRTIEDCRYWQSSDGLASGNTETEAILHGLLERIERDAETLWRLLPLSGKLATCIDPASFADPILDQMARQIAVCGLQLRLFDMTSDVAVPCYAATLADAGILTARQPRYHDVTIGHGAHPVARRAALRAVTEAAQSRLTYISGARDDVFPETFARPLPGETQRLFEAVPQRKTATAAIAEDGPQGLLCHAMQRLEEAHIRSVVVVPLVEDGDVPFSVVKVLVPDLENPDGLRKRRFGERALARALEGG